MSEQVPGKTKGVSQADTWERELQAEGRASAKALREEHA